MPHRSPIPTLLVLLFLAGCAAPAAPPPTPMPTRAEGLFENPEHRPDFLVSVYPYPGSVVNLGDSEGWQEWHSEPGWVCAHILEQPLLRPGDNWTHLDNVSLSIDEQLINDEPVNHEVEATEVYGPGGSVGAYSDYICWESQLEPGIHLAEIKVWTSTDETFVYRWAFKLG